MKRMLTIFIVIFMLLMPYAVLAETVTSTEKPIIEYDFKKFFWGASMDEVIKVEGTPLLDGKVNGVDATYIAYKTTAVGLDMILAYYFCDDGLFHVTYILNETHSNESLYIDDYEKFKSALEKKYGETWWDFENWENDSKKEYYADRKGDALCYGSLEYSTIWFLDRTFISMDMSADNYEITMTVNYESKEISPGEANFSDEI